MASLVHTEKGDRKDKKGHNWGNIQNSHCFFCLSLNEMLWIYDPHQLRNSYGNVSAPNPLETNKIHIKFAAELFFLVK